MPGPPVEAPDAGAVLTRYMAELKDRMEKKQDQIETWISG